MPDEPDMTPATRHDLAIWAGAIIAQVQAQFEAQSRQMNELKAYVNLEIARHSRANAEELKAYMDAEIASRIQGSTEELKAHMNALMEPSKDLPARVSKLEATVFAPKRKRRS